MVPDGYLAAVVTSLEQTLRPRPAPMPDSHLRLVAWRTPDPAKYRALFRRVGAPWLWFSRLVMSDAALTLAIDHPQVAVYAVVDPAGIEVGMVELDFRNPGACELAYFGLIPDLARQGHGRWLMAHTLALAWRKDVTRVWVHTCTLDHSAALGFYRAQGFVPFKREVETFPDPRLSGHLPRDASPQNALLGSSCR